MIANFKNNITLLPTIPKVKIGYNIGAPFDIFIGEFQFGKYGEALLNSGLKEILFIGGAGNTFKSTIAQYISLSVLDKYFQYCFLSAYDTETTLTYQRLCNLSQKFDKLKNIPFGDDGLEEELTKIVITSLDNADGTKVLGDEYFNLIKKIAHNIVNDKKSVSIQTPFLKPDGTPIAIRPPIISLIDTLSKFKTNDIQNKQDDISIGDSEGNTIWLRDGLAKKMLITQLPGLTSNSGVKFILTAHIGDESAPMSRFDPKKSKLLFSKSGKKAKGVSEEYMNLSNLSLEIEGVTKLRESTGKGVLYPKIESDRYDDCVDLIEVSMVITRSKSGVGSGVVIPLIISQREGVLPHLSCFSYLKDAQKITGFESLFPTGNNLSPHFMPDAKLGRTTVRTLIDENYRLRRALELLFDLTVMKMFWAPLPDNIMCTPQELYQDLISLGYNWDELLNTRGYWLPDNYSSEELPYLSILDLLRMRKQLYHPYWMTKEEVTES